MAYLSSQLISHAYYLAGIVSRDFETVSGSQLSDGLELLNEILSDKSANLGMLPYSSSYNFNAVAGQSEYFIEDLLSIEVFVFFIDNVRYETRKQQRNEFQGSFRNVDVDSLPFNWNFERKLDGGTLSLYFVPDENYPLEIWGEFALSEVTEFQDLRLTLDKFYINYLKYALAERLCDFFSYSIPLSVEKQLKRYNQWIYNNTNSMDLRLKKISSLSTEPAINYGIVNLSDGWIP